MVIFLTVIPLIGIFGTSIYIYFNGVKLFEPILLISLWSITGMGITMGYHRLFAHKSYKSNIILEWILMIFGSIALENTILKWSSDHRKHHSLSDTEDDPYTIKKGFWHAHIGWILIKTDPSMNQIVGVKDLEKKSAIQFQNKYYYHIAIIGGVFIPLLIGIIYKRPIGAILWGTMLRITLVHHATFFINSLCHYVGKRTYDYNSTSRDSWIVSLFTFGEGYHNYHHKFPSDFRNGIRWYAFDPSKWLISLLSFFKITSKLIRTKDYLIYRSKIEVVRQRIADKIKKSNSNMITIQNNVDALLISSKDILLKWQKTELNQNKNSLKKDDLLEGYKNSIQKIFNDLKIISSEISIVN